MRRDWVKSTLVETCEMYQPKTISAKEMTSDGPYPVYGANGIIGRYSQFNHAEPQLLITCRGATCGSVNISQPKSWITGNAMVVRPKTESLNIRFLEYLFRGGLDITAAITGAAQPQITRTNLNPIEICFPDSVTEQKRIVAILDEAFEGIDTAVANAEKNLANAHEIFGSYIRSLLRRPEGDGWIKTCIGDQITLQRGYDITKDDQRPGRVPVVSSGGIKSYHDTAMARAPGVVIGRKGTLGKTFYLEDDFWPHDTTLWIKDFKGNNPRFVYYFFSALDVIHLDSGTANPALNRNQVHPIKTVWPQIDRQILIAEKLDELHSETERLEATYQLKLASLAELKQAILQKAFVGELTARPSEVVQEAAE